MFGGKRNSFLTFLVLFIIIFSGCIGKESGQVSPEVKSEKRYDEWEGIKNVVVKEREVDVRGETHVINSVEFEWKGTIHGTDFVKVTEDSTGLHLAPNNEPFKDAMTWIKENTPEDSVILSWWDYGNMIRLFSHRETVIGENCGTPKCLETQAYVSPDETLFEPVEKVEDVARFFTSSEDEAYQIVQKYGVDYVMVTYEEFGKSSAINHIASDDLTIMSFEVQSTGDGNEDQKAVSDALEQRSISIYFTVNFGDHYQVWYLEDESQMGDKMLVKLLPFNTGRGQNLEHFKLEYEQKHSYVFIYKVV